MNEEPLVSIISPCYNGEMYIPQFFESILQQTYKRIELVFVNDGSTDRTEEVAMVYREKFQKTGMDFIYIYQDHAGQAAAMNAGFAAYKGAYLGWVDSDDILYPENIQKKLDFLLANEEYGFVLCEAETVRFDNLNRRRGIWKRVKPKEGDPLFLDYIYGRNVVFGPGTILVRNSAFVNALPKKRIYESKEGQNWQIMLPLSYMSKCGYIDEVLVKIVEHPDSHSRQRRTCEEELEREENFIVLCTQTIQNIPGIPDHEREEYCSLVEKVHIRNQLQIACKRGAAIRAHGLRRRLRDMGETHTVRDYVITSFVLRGFLFVKGKLTYMH